MNGEFYNLIDKFPTLKKFRFSSNTGNMNINYSGMSKILPFLEEIYFDQYVRYFTFDEVVDFIHDFYSLRVFHFQAETSVEDLLARLDTTWSATCNNWAGYSYIY